MRRWYTIMDITRQVNRVHAIVYVIHKYKYPNSCARRQHSFTLCYPTIGNNPILYNRLVSRLADVIRERTSTSRKAEVGGVVINTCGWVRGEGYNQIRHIAQVNLMVCRVDYNDSDPLNAFYGCLLTYNVDIY